MAYSRSSIEVTDEELSPSFPQYQQSWEGQHLGPRRSNTGREGGYRALKEISEFGVTSVEVEEVVIHSPSLGKKVTEHVSYVGKGEISIILAFVVMVTSVLLVEFLTKKQITSIGMDILHIVRAASLFAFSGGVTNWVAVKMLFVRIPGLFGSGVIEKHFEEIREMMKRLILDVFFDEIHLYQYIQDRENDLQSIARLESILKEFLESEGVQAVVNQKLNKLMARPEGLKLWMMGITEKKLLLWLKPVLIATALDISPLVFSTIERFEVFSARNVRKMIKGALSSKIEEITCERIKTLMEEVIAHHLGWLVVWGTVFGILIGGITESIAIFVKPFR